jgi:hypothetical protein
VDADDHGVSAAVPTDARYPMQIAAVQAQAVQAMQAPAARPGADADGDNDGAVEAAEASRTATLASMGIGQNVNLTA